MRDFLDVSVFRIGGRSALLAATIWGSVGLAQTGATAVDSVADAPAPAVAEALEAVPMAVSVFPAALLSQRAISAPLQLIPQVPNMFGSNIAGLGSANAYFIRGLGSDETIAAVDPAVGTYVDGISLPRLNGNDFGFFDIDRIAVQRGPQGVLLGRNTSGGAVNIAMKRPSETLGGYLEVAYGAYDHKLFRGSIDLPLSPMIQMKISGYFQDDDGYVQNTTTGERLNDSDRAGVRGAVQLKLTDNLTWNVAAAYMRNDGANLLNFACDPGDPANCSGRFASTGLVAAGGIASPFVGLGVSGRKAEFGLGNQVDSQLYTSDIEWAGEDFRVNVITGFSDLKQQYLLDFADGRGVPNVIVPEPPVSGLAAGGFSILNDGAHQQFSQELKISGTLFGGGLDYVGGVFYSNETNTTDFADVFNRGASPGAPVVLADRRLGNTARAIAGYAQVDANLGTAFTLTAGIRYTDEKKTLRITDNRARCAQPVAGCLDTANLFVLLPAGRVDIPTEQTAKLWTPRFAISYRPDDDMMVFASATRGYRSGGWNGRGLAPETLLPIDPETVWSYELGARAAFFDQRLRVNLTGFWLETKALQTSSAFVDPVSGSPTFGMQNFADYQNKGVELEITAAPWRGLNLYANLGYQNDRYKVSDTLLPNQFGVKAVRRQQIDCRAQLAQRRVPLSAGADNAPDCAAGIIDANGEIASPVRTPDFSMAFGGFYDFAIPAAGIILTPSIDALYRTRLETGSGNGTIFAGSVTAPSGAVFPANPFGGTVISGSLTESFWQVGAALTMRTDDNNWTLSVACANCFDTGFSQSSLFNFSYLSPPRTWQVRAKRVF